MGDWDTGGSSKDYLMTGEDIVVVDYIKTALYQKIDDLLFEISDIDEEEVSLISEALEEELDAILDTNLAASVLDGVLIEEVELGQEEIENNILCRFIISLNFAGDDSKSNFLYLTLSVSQYSVELTEK